jgi:hypothetical protein
MATDTTTKKADLTDILKKLNLSDAKAQLDTSTKKQLEEYLRQPNIDFANATNEELQNYQNALDFYKNANVGTTKGQNLADGIFEYIKGLNEDTSDPLNVGGKLTDEQIRQTADVAANKLINGDFKRSDIYTLLDQFTGKRGYNSTIASRIQSTFTPKIQDYTDTGNFDDTLLANQNAIEGITGTRKGIESDTTYLNDYLAGLPAQLEANTSGFYNDQRKQAQDYLKQYIIPEKVAPIEANPLTTDREVAQMIGNLYAGVGSNIDAAEATQAIQDAQFYGDAAYKSKMMDLINSRGNLRTQLASDYSTALKTQGQNFTKSQTALQDEFDLNLFTKENQQALNQYQAKLKQQEDRANKANEASMWGAVGGTVGAIGGAVAAGPAGAVVGSQAGKMFSGAS